MTSAVTLQRLIDELVVRDEEARVSLTIECAMVTPPVKDRSNFKEYLRLLDAAAAEAKAPLLSRLREVPAVEVVELRHAPQLLVTAPTRQWLAWLRPGGILAKDTEVSVFPSAHVVGGGDPAP